MNTNALKRQCAYVELCQMLYQNLSEPHLYPVSLSISKHSSKLVTVDKLGENPCCCCVITLKLSRYILIRALNQSINLSIVLHSTEVSEIHR